MSGPSSDSVLLDVTEGVATVTFNRPERHNALDDHTSELFEQTWGQVVADRGVRVIVLRGEGPSFCSGRDTAQLGERPGGESDLSFMRRHQTIRKAQLDCPKPVIAALHGHTLGGGLEIALAADFRIAAPDLRMAFPEIRYGLMTDTGGSPMATALIGPAKAKWMLMTGMVIEAERALAWGLVDEVVPSEEVDPLVQSIAKRIAGHPVDALAMIKSTVDGMWGEKVRAGMAAELVAQAALFAGEDYRERKRARVAAQRES